MTTLQIQCNPYQIPMTFFFPTKLEQQKKKKKNPQNLYENKNYLK